jgi:hypothetical protein
MGFFLYTIHYTIPINEKKTGERKEKNWGEEKKTGERNFSNLLCAFLRILIVSFSVCNVCQKVMFPDKPDKPLLKPTCKILNITTRQNWKIYVNELTIGHNVQYLHCKKIMHVWCSYIQPH